MIFYGEKFKKERLLKRISVNHIAKAININRTTLWNWENNKRTPSEANVRLLAKAISVNLDQISDIIPQNIRNEFDLHQQFSSFKNLTHFASNNPDSIIGQLKKQINILEKELRQASIIINAFLGPSTTAFYIKDTKLRYITVNDSFFSLFNLKKDIRVTGKKDSYLFNTKDAKSNTEQDAEIINTGKAIINQEDYVPGTRKSKWALISKQPIKDPVGKILGIFCSFTDITSKKLLENKLIESEEKLNNLINSTLHMLMIKIHLIHFPIKLY
jgi:PAS domain S-box-containing protein